jgi:hypothetical protein
MTKGQEIVQHEAVPLPVAQPMNLLQAIIQAASDPNIDINKMERLMAMKKDMDATQAEAEFNQAVNACQIEMRPIAADAMNPQTRSRYATFGKIDAALRPIYTRHGISISFSTEDSPKEDHIRVVAYVSRGSFTRQYRIDMPADGKGAKGNDVMTKTHAAGAAMSYASRYLLKGIFNVAVGEQDDDGNGGKIRTLTEEQKAKFREAMELVDDIAKWGALWQQITAATSAAGDVASHEELRSEMAKKRKEITA